MKIKTCAAHAKFWLLSMMLPLLLIAAIGFNSTAFAHEAGRRPANGLGRGGGDLVLTRYLLALQLAQVGIKAIGDDQRFVDFKPYRQRVLERLSNLRLEVESKSYGLISPLTIYTERGTETLPLYLGDAFGSSSSNALMAALSNSKTLYLDRSAIEKLPGDLFGATVSMLEAGCVLSQISQVYCDRHYQSQIANVAFKRSKGVSATDLLGIVMQPKAVTDIKTSVTQGLGIAQLALAQPDASFVDLEIGALRNSMNIILGNMEVGKGIVLIQSTIQENGIPKAAFAAISPDAKVSDLMRNQIQDGLQILGVSPPISKLTFEQITRALNDRPIIYVSVPYLLQFKPKPEEIAALLIHEVGHLAGIVGPDSHERLDRYASHILGLIGYVPRNINF